MNNPLFPTPDVRPYPPESYTGDVEGALATIREIHERLDTQLQSDMLDGKVWDREDVLLCALQKMTVLSTSGSRLTRVWLSCADISTCERCAQHATELYCRKRGIV